MKIQPMFPELTLEHLKQIDGLEFEDLCFRLFKVLYPDYYVQRTGVNDFGADLIVHFDHDRKMVIQCKTAQNGKQIGIRAVQEIIAAQGFYDAEFACVVANVTFTDAAKEMADANNVTLMDVHELIDTFSYTIFSIEDIPLLYDRLRDAFSRNDILYLEKFKDNPELLFEMSELETLYFLKLCMDKTLQSCKIEIDTDLLKGIHHVMYLAVMQNQNAEGGEADGNQSA